MIELIDALIEARRMALQTEAFLHAAEQVVTSLGLPEECNHAMQKEESTLAGVAKRLEDHIINIGHGVKVDDVRFILNHGTPEKNA